jgi:DNA repair protein RecO (recombination protein O)
MIERTEAVILKTQNWSETSRIVSAFTRHFGRMKFVAKGARKPRSKFGAALQPGVIAQLIFYRSRHSEMHTVSESDLVWDSTPLAEGGLMPLASVALELGHNVTALESPNLAFYRNLSELLMSLPGGEPAGLRLLDFYLSGLNNLGYGLKLNACAQCRRELSSGTPIFSVAQGGFLCSRCRAPEGECLPLKPCHASALFRWHSEGRLEDLPEGEVKPVLELLSCFVNHHISGRTKLKCFKYLE